MFTFQYSQAGEQGALIQRSGIQGTVDKGIRTSCLRQTQFNKENREANEDGPRDKCTLFSARAKIIDGHTLHAGLPSGDFLCVELVGDRFLRRMVRIIVVSGDNIFMF